MAQAAPMKTSITEIFNTKYPIISAPMFLVSNEKMVVAASEAGGIGTFPALNYRPIEKLRTAFQTIKSQTTKPFGVNIIVQESNKYLDQHLDLALEAGAAMIITSLGSPKKVIERARGTQTKVFCDVVGLAHAKKVYDLGADGLIAVSSGAGGHAGDVSPFALIPYLKAEIPLPLIAAGAISDGRGMLAALSLGADAIYMGTRMIASQESPVSQDYKDAILKAECTDIINTDRVDGFPGNFIKSDLLLKLLKGNFVDNVLSQNKKVKRWVSLLRASKVLFGNPEQKVSYKNIFSAGHGVSAIESLLTIDEIMQKTMNEYRQLKKGLPE